ncbi:MAG: phosphoribosylformylglycinamidine cyclo-ligase [Cyanobacteria bacterium J06638_22]
MDYREAGVDVEAGRAFVQRIQSLVHGTHRPGVLGGLGGFSGMFEVPSGYQEPVLVSGTDGVGTKLKLAQGLNRHNTVGIDLVAMCVNDVLTSGAEPLFFLDYLATGKLNEDQLAAVVEGVSVGCRQAGCALLGGETAEMPGFYQPGEYDLAGFCVGIVEKQQIVDGVQVQVGDVAIALPSSGIHSNGYSLIRKILDTTNTGLDERPTLLQGEALGDVLLKPTQIYVKPVLATLRSGISVHGMAHITGGGLPENLPRCLGEGQSIQVNLQSWTVLPIFEWFQEMGAIARPEMFNTFNMGVGFVMLVPPTEAASALACLQKEGIDAWTLGEVIPGNSDVVFSE